MRVLIVDDEAPARAKLRRMLAVFDDVEVIGEAGDGAQALALAAQLAADAIFLDVQMPEVGGFDVAASLPDGGPCIVFVTAHDRYALAAFDTHAVDYLLKPVAPERLERAVQRLRSAPRLPARAKVGGTGEPAQAPRQRSGTPKQLLIEDRGQTHVVRCEDIEWLAAADNYVELHLRASAALPSRMLLMRRTLAALIDDLGPAFLRTHRSAAVAVGCVQSVLAREKGDATVLMQSGAEVPCSRQHRVGLIGRLQARS
ncbi:LytTR family DNA-binding domain-containing protein [soil metagenome]